MDIKILEMREKQLAELLGAKVLWECISAVERELKSKN